MYPAQTSFIPVTIAIVNFVEKHGFEGLYPYWYLGSTPVKYLAGPLIPSVLIALHRSLDGFSLFDLTFTLVVISLFIFSIGWGMLAWQLSSQRRIGVLVGVISLLLPWHIVSWFGLSEVSAVLATALTPWVLFAFAKTNFHFSVLRKYAPVFPISNLWLSAVAFTLLLLTNTTASIPAVIGLIILGILIYKKWEKGLKRALLVIFFGWILTLWWYPPNYWWMLLIAPSIGGSPAAGALIHLVNLMRGFVPVILAIFLVIWGVGKKDSFSKFSLSWISVFGLLTLFRFFGDPKFWLDWTSWLGEVEIGLAMVIASNFRFQKISQLFGVYSFVIGILLIGSWFLAWQNRSFWLPRSNIDNTVEYRITRWLDKEIDDRKQETGNSPIVFLSGSTAFWLNSLTDVRQVRGGVDQVSQDRDWRQATWEIREGQDPQKSAKWVEELQIKYLVVHDEESQEYYHDFKYPEKFNQISSLIKVYEEDGDVIYKVASD